ncbi:MAG: hypothetical protein VKN33_03370 [Candidatus Sericytochromatia bacterium]|nr:hypothetical protein [Candidatus Sericytochromatia bacterium]
MGSFREKHLSSFWLGGILRTITATLLVLALLGANPAPAEAHIVYFKDGTIARGNVVVKENTLLISGGGAELSFPLETVRAVSFNDEPIGYEQQRLEESKFLNNDALIWSWFAANVLGTVVAFLGIVRRSE